MNNSWQPADQPESNNNPGSPFFGSIRRSGWVRTRPRWLGGVCAGLAEHTGWDVALIRGVVVVTTVFFWFPLFFYGLAWLLLPATWNGVILLEDALRGRFHTPQVWASLMIALGLLNPVPYYLLFAAPWYWLIGLGLIFALTYVLWRARSGQATNNPSGERPARHPSTGNTSFTSSSFPEGGNHVSYPPASPGSPGSTGGTNPNGAYQQPGYWPANVTPPPAGPPPGYPPAGPYPSANVPPYSPPATPVLSSRTSMLVVGGLFIFGAILVTFGWVGTGGHDPSTMFVLGAVGTSVSLAVIGATLAYAGIRGLRAGWFLAVSIVAAIILFPIGLGSAAGYNNYAAHDSVVPGSHMGTHHQGALVPCWEGFCAIEGGSADFDHTAKEISAISSQVTLDLTRVSEEMTRDITMNLDDSEGVILVRPDQALQLYVAGNDSQFTKITTNEESDWFPSALSGDFVREGSNALFTSQGGAKAMSTFTLRLNLDSSSVQLRVADPRDGATAFSERRRPTAQSGATTQKEETPASEDGATQ